MAGKGPPLALEPTKAPFGPNAAVIGNDDVDGNGDDGDDDGDDDVRDADSDNDVDSDDDVYVAADDDVDGDYGDGAINYVCHPTDV